ncbi:unnamed protein product [Ilex paraguariensis]|uniref:Uncharacterized protein n=1 Tax=Ilex paraguariensis TaxID=185542 RepID=A0ABC8SNU8_9AQUA
MFEKVDGKGHEDSKIPNDKNFIQHLSSRSATVDHKLSEKSSKLVPMKAVRSLFCLLLPWAAKVAREFHIPAALLWIQSATVLDIYYYYFNGSFDINVENCKDPSWSIELQGLPLVETLEEETNPIVLVSSFNALEPEALKAIDKYNLIGIGLLIPSAFLD